MIEARYFDGRSTRIHRVVLSLAEDRLVIAGDGIDLRVPFSQVTVDEKLGRAARKIRLASGAFCEAADIDAAEALLAAAGHRDGRVDRLQRRFTVALLAAVSCIGLAIAAYLWGLPWLAEIGARHLPPSLGKTLSTQTLAALDGHFLLPSKIAEDRQAAITARYRALHLPEGGAPASPLLFRDSPALGANAFTLPDGTVVVLDGLVTLIGDEDQIVAVLAHELGHAHRRHGLQLLLRSSAVGAFWTFYIGDVSQLLAAAPTLLIQEKYSRELEAEADEYGATLLAANGLSPALLADALESLEKQHHGAAPPSYLANHPPTEERIGALRRHRSADLSSQ